VGERCSCPAPSLHGPPSTPEEGKAGRKGKEVHACGGVDLLCCWVQALVLPPPLQVGGVLCAGVVPGCDPFLQEERSAHHGGLNSEPRWLTANWC
jgi:hypothetical protein